MVFIVRFAGVVIAMPYGLEMAAWAIVFSSIVDLIFKTIVIRKIIGVKVRRLVIAFFPNVVITLVCWAVASLINQIMPFEESNVWRSLLVLTLCMPPTWLILLRITKHEAWDLIIDIAGKVIKKKITPDG